MAYWGVAMAYNRPFWGPRRKPMRRPLGRSCRRGNLTCRLPREETLQLGTRQRHSRRNGMTEKSDPKLILPSLFRVKLPRRGKMKSRRTRAAAPEIEDRAIGTAKRTRYGTTVCEGPACSQPKDFRRTCGGANCISAATWP